MGASFELGWGSNRKGVRTSQGPNKKRPQSKVSAKGFKEETVMV